MCNHHNHAPRAISLDHGHDHDRDHIAWTRRDFLVRAGLGGVAAATAPAWVGRTEARALSGSSLLNALSEAETDRVLVLVQLKGGNDGLNTVIPIRNDLYYAARPTIGIASGDTHALSDDFGMHPQMAALAPTWAQGNMAVVHSVGYPNSSLSHFLGTDNWLRGSDSASSTGWAGRSLGAMFPDSQSDPSEAPTRGSDGHECPAAFQRPRRDHGDGAPQCGSVPSARRGR